VITQNNSTFGLQMNSFKKKSNFITILFCTGILCSISNYAAILPSNPNEAKKTEIKIKVPLNKSSQLSKKNKKESILKVKAIFQKNKDIQKNIDRNNFNKILAIILAVFIPPVGVAFYENKLTTKFWISLMLSFIYWLPGMIYSLLVVTGNA
jgi:uncharacterized membrane protein YqaE (UPF0057 family)